MQTLTLTTIGNSTGVILPKELLTRLKIEKGDKIFLTETKDGFQVTVYDRAFEKEMQAAESVMRRYRNALRELAK
jgi:putative addiction module antidote